MDWIILCFSKLKKQIELGRYSSMYADVNDDFLWGLHFAKLNAALVTVLYDGRLHHVC